MNFLKAFSRKQDALQFKKEYSEEKIQTEVINTILASNSSSTEVNELMEFFISKHNPLRLVFVANEIAPIALKEIYGNHDFTITSTKRYSNWVLNFQNRLFIVPNKREVVLTKEDYPYKSTQDLTLETIHVAIEFEKQFLNFCVNFALNNPAKISPAYLNVLKEFEQNGVIKNSEIDFNFFKKNECVFRM